MRYIEIDGETYDVECCEKCPCYEWDDGAEERCRHPKGDGQPAFYGGTRYEEMIFGPNCPLRVKE